MMEMVSFVIPCYRSEKTIGSVIEEIQKVMSELQFFDYEIIAVSDGSPDNVFEVLKEYGRKDNRIKAICLMKNFGQPSAIMAGINYAYGDYIVYLDDDGQCPVDRVDSLLKPLNEGWDIAMASYSKKKQSIFKNIGSKLNDFTSYLLTDRPQGLELSNFIAFTRNVANEIRKYQGPYPYIAGLLLRVSKKVINVPMEERSRMEGKTSYTLAKLINLYLNSFTAFSIKPLRFASIIGTLFSFIGIIFTIFIVIRKIMEPGIAAGWSSLMSVVIFFSGLLLMVMGIIGEYVGRIYMTICSTPQFIVRETCNIGEDIENEY